MAVEVLAGALLITVAKSVAAKAGAELGRAGFKELKNRVLGDPEEKALARALERAYARMVASHGDLLGEFEVTPGFLEFEGASELAKVLVPNTRADPAKLAGDHVDSHFPGLDDDTRWDYVGRLRPAFRDLLEALQEEVGRERALDDIVGRVDEARVAVSTERLARLVGAAVATDSDQAAYLHWLIDAYRYLRTAGMVSNTTVQIPLQDVFVSLRGIREERPGDRGEEWRKLEHTELDSQLESGELDQIAYEAALDRLSFKVGYERSGARLEEVAAPVAVTDAVRGASHLLVLGDPGCGKTTLLRYLALRHARALLRTGTDSDQDLGGARLPIFVRIGDFARSPRREEGLGRFLPEYLESQECHTPGLRDLLDKNLDGGGCLVLLDGLDEVASAADRQAVVAAVTSLVTANSRQGNRFIVTSRIAGYSAAPLPPEFEAVRVQEMDDPTIERFLAAYCPAVERAEAPKKSDNAVRRDSASAAADLLEALRQNAGVRRLAANPLLLTALLLVHRARGRLPHRRVDAYVEVTEALGRTWRSVQGVPEAELPDDRILTTWLTRLGAWMHQYRPEGSANRRELLEVLGPLWAEHVGTKWNPGLLLAADPLESAAGRGILDFVDKTEVHTGLLVERAAGRYGFPHLTFEEYYAGRALAFEGLAADRPSTMRSRLHDPRYDEPILLGLGLVGRVQPEEVERLMAEAILGASGVPTRYEELLGRDFLFSLRVLADDVPLGAISVDRLLQQAMDEWFDPNSRCRFSKYQAALQERLSGLGATRGVARLHLAMDTLAESLAATAPTRLTEMALVLTSLGSLTPEVITALVALATGSDDPYVRVKAAGVLGQAQALTPEVITALVALTTGSDDPSVRVEAVRVLGQAEALTPEVITALVALATGSDDSYARVQAAGVLGQAEALTPEVITALVALATGSDDSSVRVEAAGVLGQAQALTPEVITALVALATGSDPKRWDIRVNAVTILGHAESTPELETALVRLFTDDVGGVRRTAGTSLASLARRCPLAAPRIAERLVHACSDPELDTLDRYEQRPGWDYAYDTLWTVATLAYSASVRD